MLKFAPLMLALMILAGCDRAPAPSRASSQAFEVLSEQANSSAGSDIVNIRIHGSPAEANVREIAEKVIAARQEKYQTIVVKSYLAGATVSDTPYAVSILEGGAVSHKFNQPAASQKIPTH